jgi:putative membrane protein insertion efficiency factor
VLVKLRDVPRRVLQSAIRIYQYTLSPFIGNQCRFYPSCSHYAHQAIEEHGALRGTWLALRRLSRCHPFHPGGVDPVPTQRSRS